MAKLNLNTYPYYDDFDLDKNFHKVLFKPGFAVQARELTQLQTILQDQIKRFGDHVFKEGSVISGCPESTNFNVDVVKILDTDNNGAALSDETLESFVGKTFVGATNGVQAVVKKFAAGTETTDFKALFLQYTTQGTSGTTTTFVADEVLQLSTDSDVTVVVADASQSPITTGSLFSVGDGIVYANGHFIRHYSQTIVLSKYDSTPTRKVGFLVNEEIVSSNDDETLLDPAQGSFNFTAPGADRFKLSTTIVSYQLTDVVEGFYILYEVQSGRISRRYDRSQYAELNKTLARRTFDESGNYVVEPFSYHVREHLKTSTNDGVYTVGQGGDANKLALGIEPGKAYVRGFEYELFATKYIDVDKSTDSLTRTDINISTGYGNYFIVDEVSGEMPVNGTLVDLYDTAQGAVTAGTHSNTTASGSIIGRARVNSIEHKEGTPGSAAATYRLYLYDVEMTDDSLVNVRSIVGSNTDPKLFADIADTTYGAVLRERKFSPLVFPTTYNYVKSLSPSSDSNSFVYRKLFTGVSIASDGSGSVTLSAGDETFAFTTSTDATILAEFMVVAEADISDGSPVFTKGQVIDMTSATTTVSPGSTTINFNIDTGGSLTGSPTVSVYASVSKGDVAPRTKTFNPDRFVRLITTNKLGYVSAGTYLDLDTAVSTGADTIEYVYNASVDITTAECPVGSLIYTDGNVLLGTVASVTPKNDGTTTGPIITLAANSAANVSTGITSTPLKVAHPNWDVEAKKFTTNPSLGLYDVLQLDSVKVGDAITSWTDVSSSGTVVTDNFLLNTGQKDTHYDLASISGSFAEEKRYVIQLDHFTHNSGSFFTVDSYPLPAQGSSPTSSQIDWYQIPKYVGNNGIRYRLRDCVDFRSTVANVATSTQTLASASINPIGYTISSKSFTGFTPFYTPHAQEEFQTDVEWNLSRIDRAILDEDGNFTIIEGVASNQPLVPIQPANSMSLGTILLPPYPALSPKTAQRVNALSHSAFFDEAKLQKRYTMSDIGVIDKRITDLEIFTKLSFLEQKTINTLLYNAAGDQRFKNGVLVDSFERDSNKAYLDNVSTNCALGDGVLTVKRESDSLELEYSGDSTDIYLKPTDAKIVVRQSVSGVVFTSGETVTQSTSGATGTIEHAVEIARGGNYKWTRLYLKEVSGTFSANVSYTVTGGTSAATGVITYTGMTTAILATDFRPDLISVPSDGQLATLAYSHQVYTENPYASESVTVTNEVVYGYEGTLEPNPPEDPWFETRKRPSGPTRPRIEPPPFKPFVPPEITCGLQPKPQIIPTPPPPPVVPPIVVTPPASPTTSEPADDTSLPTESTPPTEERPPAGRGGGDYYVDFTDDDSPGYGDERTSIGGYEQLDNYSF